MKIFIFTWNNQSVVYNKHLQPNFLLELKNKINSDNPSLIAIALQEDASNSKLYRTIKKTLPDYQIVDKVTLMGWGKTTIKNLYKYKYEPRGLRLLLFKKKNLDIEIKTIECISMLCPSWRDWITFGKGAVGISIGTNLGVFTFLNIHLPFYSKTSRDEAVSWQSYCLTYFYNRILSTSPDYLFLCGDLNFRVQLQKGLNAQDIASNLFTRTDYLQKLFVESDELNLVLQYTNLQKDMPLLEGIENKGPNFYPTCKLNKNRGPIEESLSKVYKLGKTFQRTPSWCDRILYQNFNNSTINCLEYHRFDIGNMNLSDHAAVYGLYSV